ncbi:Tigger transposable element-derived protein 6 [Stylophora pistillata]|uniref:Tigger transposable element-derived protein 6 n=1 Tax=Stylophora pistillata TaxID=50429 RepID=A0A2B4S0S6_STYPI|nr:Tigger transposable element-derived protein 6 [Stylophora pistillata]
MKVAEKLDYPEFKASSGWLTRFKERNNLWQHKLCGESADVPEATVYSWKEHPGSIISGYAMQDIWNMDETGCLYRALPDKSLSEKAKKCRGGKKSKERLTVAFFVSATGERRKPVVIGKKLVLRHIISMTTDHDSTTDTAKTLDVVQAIRWMGTAWSKVENDTIIKCFAAAGISSTFSEAVTVSIVTGEEDPFADLDVSADEELENLAQ